jgi:hypothetical protein
MFGLPPRTHWECHNESDVAFTFGARPRVLRALLHYVALHCPFSDAAIGFGVRVRDLMNGFKTVLSPVAGALDKCGAWGRKSSDGCKFCLNKRTGGRLIRQRFVDYARLGAVEFGKGMGLNKRTGGC